MGYNINSRDALIGPYAIQKLLRNAFVMALRDAFKTDTVYTFKERDDKTTDTDKTFVEIVDIAPFSTVKMPCILVESVMDRGGSFFFSDDLITEKWEDGVLQSEIHGNQLFMGVSFRIQAWDSVARDELCDRVYIYLRTVRDILAPLGIECRQVEVGSPSEEVIGGREAFVGGIHVNTISEWTYEKLIPLNEILTGVSMQITGLTGPSQ